MRYLPLIGVLSFMTTLGAMSSSCSGTERIRPLCTSDAFCQDQYGNENWYCDRADGGVCACANDDACQGEEYCELKPAGDGACHPKVTCEWNADCKEVGGGFCDRNSGFCRHTGCKDDLQCDVGQICDRVTDTCVPGCRSHGDCVLGDACMCSDSEGNPVACVCDNEDRSQCRVGVCMENVCPPGDSSFCKYGDICTPNGDNEFHSCQPDPRPFCDACDPSTPRSPCGSEGPNYCLGDQFDPSGLGSFCGVDCSEGQACPSGFSCREVLRPTQNSCGSGFGACQAGTNPPVCGGEDDEPCPPGSECKGGVCVGQCFGAEGGSVGWCSCVSDDDCPKQVCENNGRCSITKKFCDSDADCTGPGGGIVCKNNGEVGFCHIGNNCAPDTGISCHDVRCAQSPDDPSCQ